MIGGFRSDLSITRKTDGNFGNISVFQNRVSTKTVVVVSVNNVMTFAAYISDQNRFFEITIFAN